MKYLGHAVHTQPGGWGLHSFADDWIGATQPTDDNGPMIFKPTTVKVDGAEYQRLRDSHHRHLLDPDAERAQAGRFWDCWTLHTNGTITRKA